jgi:hypothetical protein
VDDNLQQRLRTDKMREKKKELLLKLKEEDEAKKIMNADRGGKGSLKNTITNKKTIRRVYNVGKSGVVRKVGVLVSSQGYRNTVLTKKKTLKTDSIGHVSKYLCDKGLIKVGSTAPEEVLRELYENAELVGNLQNHNVENLLQRLQLIIYLFIYMPTLYHIIYMHLFKTLLKNQFSSIKI